MSSEKMIVWSQYGENFSDNEKRDALDTAYHIGKKVGDKIFFGEAKSPDAADFVSADRVIEDMGECAYDNHGEFAENFPDVTPEAKLELENMLTEWARKHCKPDFYSVHNIQEYIITVDDFAEFAKGPE